ncbi:hypothetical protein FP372_00005 [Escherichia coli]|nr:hypothetical protein [Escherichia coli]EFN7217568.1 hypothetical protein [Escherichia coli]MBY5275357.1 hypothetical protein [Escherichia coli]MFA98803.1 hypothetical protein [Escherichia coli]MGS84633.1 hypothetical protein [Escherichia coli]
MLGGEVVKEKQTSASFDITAIFLLVMQVVVGASKALHWIARRCASLEYNRFDDKKLAQEDKNHLALMLCYRSLIPSK